MSLDAYLCQRKVNISNVLNSWVIFFKLHLTINEFRIGPNINIREGQKESMLLESEMRSLQFRVYQETQSIYSNFQQEISDLVRKLGNSTNQERCELVHLEGQMGNLRMENNRDRHVVEQLASNQENLSRNMGTDDDFFEIIPGYTQPPVNQQKQNQKH